MKNAIFLLGILLGIITSSTAAEPTLAQSVPSARIANNNRHTLQAQYLLSMGCESRDLEHTCHPPKIRNG